MSGGQVNGPAGRRSWANTTIFGPAARFTVPGTLRHPGSAPRGSMSTYKVDQRHLNHNGRVFHFVSYEGQPANLKKEEAAVEPSWTATTPSRFGSRWRSTTRVRLPPRARAASMNAASRKTRVCASARRAKGAHAVSTKTAPRCARVGVRTADKSHQQDQNKFRGAQ